MRTSNDFVFGFVLGFLLGCVGLVVAAFLKPEYLQGAAVADGRQASVLSCRLLDSGSSLA